MALSKSAARLSRLLRLLAVLSETPVPLTAAELRAEVGGDDQSDEAFKRNFARDKEELRALGVELEVVERRDVDPPVAGYRIQRSNFALRDPGLEPDEAAALQLAVSLVRLDGVADTDGLWKVAGTGAGLGGPGAGEASALPASPAVAELFSAVADRRRATFGYRDRQRRVDPYRLAFTRGRWYLTAAEDGVVKHFRLDRIEGVPALGSAYGFDAPDPEAVGDLPEPWLLGDGPATLAWVAVDGPQAPLVRAVLGDEAVVEEADDGAVVVELAVTHVDGFRSFVLGFLEHAEVLGPPHLRAAVVDWLEAAAGEGR